MIVGHLEPEKVVILIHQNRKMVLSDFSRTDRKWILQIHVDTVITPTILWDMYLSSKKSQLSLSSVPVKQNKPRSRALLQTRKWTTSPRDWRQHRSFSCSEKFMCRVKKYDINFPLTNFNLAFLYIVEGGKRKKRMERMEKRVERTHGQGEEVNE